MNMRKYLVETNIRRGDRFVEFFDTLEEAKNAYDDIFYHTTENEKKNREILLGYIERTEKYIDEDYLTEDNWYEWYTGFDNIPQSEI